MSERVERAVTGLLVLAAGYFAIASVRSQFKGRVSPAVAEADKPPERLQDWDALVAAGVLLEDSSAEVRVLVLSDLECPYCRQFHSRIRNLQRSETDVALIFVHYPLDRHRFARPAARALECSGEEGRFSDFLDRVYEYQDSLGFKTLTAFAMDAGVRDTARFNRCVADTVEVERIERGLALGKKIGLRGTPTVVVNGWHFNRIPDEDLLRETFRRLRSGEPPPGAAQRN
jgi:protein-disulfide isomerase